MNYISNESLRDVGFIVIKWVTSDKLWLLQYWFFLILFQLSEEQNEMTSESNNFLKDVTVLLFHTCFKETNQFYIVFISALMFNNILFLCLFSAIITTLFSFLSLLLQKNRVWHISFLLIFEIFMKFLWKIRGERQSGFSSISLLIRSTMEMIFIQLFFYIHHFSPIEVCELMIFFIQKLKKKRKKRVKQHQNELNMIEVVSYWQYFFHWSFIHISL